MQRNFLQRIPGWMKAIVLSLIGLMIMSSCGGSDLKLGTALPEPGNAKYETVLVARSDNSGTNILALAPFMKLDFGDAANVKGETVLLPQLNGKMAETLSTTWASWDKGKVRTTKYLDSHGQLLAGLVTESIDSDSIIGWLKHGFGYTADRSELDFVYIVPTPGADPVLTRIVYNEKYGLSGSDLLPVGQVAIWSSGNLGSVLGEQYTRWGFWENTDDPYKMITDAIGNVQSNFTNYPPDYDAVHSFDLASVIGRHSGFTLYSHGHQIGTIDMTYDNTFGRAPNTDFIGDGALSKVEWHLKSKYYALDLVTPPGWQTPSSLYVFTTSSSTESQLNNADGPKLYRKINAGIPGVFLAIHALGDIVDTQGSGSTSNGDSANVTTGSGGGLAYSVFGNPSYEDVALARGLLSMLGQNGLAKLGLYYPTKTKSGSGLDYYAAILLLATAKPADVFDKMASDVGVLDRVGIDIPLELLG